MQNASHIEAVVSEFNLNKALVFSSPENDEMIESPAVSNVSVMSNREKSVAAFIITYEQTFDVYLD